MNANEIESHCHKIGIEKQMLESVKRNDLFSLHFILDKYPFTLECVDEYSNTPLLLACYRGYDRIVAHLLKCGAEHRRINVFGKYLHVVCVYSAGYGGRMKQYKTKTNTFFARSAHNDIITMTTNICFRF